jgi:signal transduction histidine kinase
MPAAVRRRAAGVAARSGGPAARPAPGAGRGCVHDGSAFLTPPPRPQKNVAVAATTTFSTGLRLVREVWRGLAAVLAGSDPPPRWRSPAQRQAAYVGLAAATLLAGATSLASRQSGQLFGPPGLLPAVGSDVPSALVAAAAVAPLLLADRYPLLGWRFGWLMLLLTPLAGLFWWGRLPWDPVQLIVLVALFVMAAVRHERPVGWWLWALTLIPWWLWLWRGPFDGLGHQLPTAVAGTVGLTVVAVAADAVGSRGRARRALAGQAELTELERARRTGLEERARIARELHDVVAHHMSLIAVRAETAPYRLAELPDPVAAEFGSLSGAAREALADMRRLLGVLRDDQPPARAPQPRLPDLPGLIETARRAGVSVEFSLPGGLDPVPAGVEVCAYRIVQESLSNARRHAPGAPVTVSVAQRRGALVLLVANGPAGPPVDEHRPSRAAAGAGPAGGPGQGLTGMRERVALLGGSLSAGPSPGGGFVVSAVLPAGERA